MKNNVGVNSRSLNPFGTGQCLTTEGAVLDLFPPKESQSLWNRAVSYDIDLFPAVAGKLSQSLWNRAVSYDPFGIALELSDKQSQSLWNRAVSYDNCKPVDGY